MPSTCSNLTTLVQLQRTFSLCSIPKASLLPNQIEYKWKQEIIWSGAHKHTQQQTFGEQGEMKSYTQQLTKVYENRRNMFCM